MVKKILGLFGSGREEDRLVGYLSFLKARSILAVMSALSMQSPAQLLVMSLGRQAIGYSASTWCRSQP